MSPSVDLEPHPEPPGALGRREIPLDSVSRPWYRIHPADRDPLHFGTTARNRFDAPGGDYGVLYLAADPHGAFIETFGHDTGRTDFVTRQALEGRHLARVETSRPLRLVDLTGPGLARLGADGRLTAGDPAVAQRWSEALHGHPAEPDGLLYRVRHDLASLAVAVFDRAATVTRAVPLGSLADPEHEELLADILETYGFGLV